MLARSCLFAAAALRAATAEEYQYVKLQSLSSGSDSFCVGELELYDSYRQISLQQYESCSATSSLEGFECENAFQGNGDADLGFCSDPASSLLSAGTELDGAVGSLTIFMSPGDDVTKFKITALSDGGSATAPTAFELYGSNGGGEWTKLHEESGLSWEDGETKTFYTDGSCDAINRWGTGEEDFDETCASKNFDSCTGAYSTVCEWKEETYFESCLAILLDGTTQSGTYEIYVTETEEFVSVYCDMSIGGWTRVLNLPSTETTGSIFDAGTGAIGDNALTADAELYKLSDATINALLGDDAVFQYRCGSVDYFVQRDAGWVTEAGQSGWTVDRDMDGTPDCDASVDAYLFSDYTEGQEPLEGASIEECSAEGHTEMGLAGGSDLGCYAASEWGHQAQVYVRNVPADQLVVESCADLSASDWTGIYLTQYGALYCNQDLEGGGVTGGWTLLMKTSTSGNLMQYDADYWSTSNTLNGDGLFTYPINFQPVQAKLEAFNGDHAGYTISFNEYLAFWPTFESESNTWYIGIFESMTALQFFQTPRTLSNAVAATDDFNGDYFSSESVFGKSGICYSGSDSDSSVRWGYVFAGADSGAEVTALGGIGLDALTFTNGISSGDQTVSGVSVVAANSAENSQTSYPVQLYGRVYTGDTYDDCSALSVDDASGLYYTADVSSIYCDNELEDGGWTMVLKTIGVGTEITYTSDYITTDAAIGSDPATESLNMDAEDAKLWTFSDLEMDQFLFYYPNSGTTFVTGMLETPMTSQAYFSTYDTYQADAPLDEEATVVFGRRYFDGGVCARSTLLDCTSKYFAGVAVDGILTRSPAPSPFNEPTFSNNGYEAVGSSCNTLQSLSVEDFGYTSTGSIGGSIVSCGAACDSNSECAGFELSSTSCTLVGDVSNPSASSNGNEDLAITGGNICYAQVDSTYTTAPPPMWDELPETVLSDDGSYNGWGLWDSDASEDWQYCADTPVVDDCSGNSLDECLALCEASSDVEFCSYGAYASSGNTENNAAGPGGSECCYGTSTCDALTTSTNAQAAHYAIYQRLYEQTSEYRACETSSDCNDAYYCAAYLLPASSGSATAELFLGTQIADTMVMCLPCVDATGKTCSDWGDAIDSCDACAAFATAADMPVIERECGLDQYIDTNTGVCNPCTTSCEEGHYLSGDRCTGAETSDPVSCVPCKDSCPGVAGLTQYMTGACSGTAYEDEIVCVDCTLECEEGYFLDYSDVTESQSCNGAGFQSPVCSPCTSRCNTGFYLQGTCDGSGTENEVTCVECANECADGQYVDNVCSGLGTTDDTSCVDCISSCNSDEYMVGTCDGTGSHDSIYCQQCNMICLEGQYFSARCDGTTTSDPLTCFDCTTECPDGYFMQGLCDGLGDSDDVTCVSCDDCSSGVMQSDGFNCESTCLNAIIASVSEGDQTNKVYGQGSFVGAGVSNTAMGDYSVVSTGIYNAVDGVASVVAGGAYNKVGSSADYSFIAGGDSNTILGTYGVIGGGTSNLIAEGDYSVIGAGSLNYVEGDKNAIHGGTENSITGSTSKSNVIAGGEENSMDSAKWGTILGGKRNTITSSNYATILGGANNVVLSSSNFAMIGGGNKNTVEGKMSLAIGSKAETRAAYSATFGFQTDECETRAERVVNFCADDVAINGEPVLTLFVQRRRALEQHEEATLKGVSEVIFKQEKELAALDEEMDQILKEVNAMVAEART